MSARPRAQGVVVYPKFLAMVLAGIERAVYSGKDRRSGQGSVHL